MGKMHTSTMIIGIVLCAFVGAILYVWGLKRQMNKTQDLLNLLFSNGMSRVNRYMKKNEFITKKETEDLVTGMTAKLPFSKDKSVVTDPRDFADKLLEYMVKTGQLKFEKGKYYKTK